MELAYIGIAFFLLAVCFTMIENDPVLNSISIKYEKFRTISRTISSYLYPFNSIIHSKTREKPLAIEANGDKDN
tara:strand:- start:760 stop:981 length:222 start_codon:yes stop_codon:yes gene_type:complete